jgi:hypoxanthine phosphoribosyltransferase
MFGNPGKTWVIFSELKRHIILPPSSHFMSTKVRLHDKTFVPFITSDQLQAKNQQLGRQITDHYRANHSISDQNPLLLISVLKGSFVFLADLIRHIDLPVEVEFIGLSSYHGATETSGVVQETIPLRQSIHGRHILIAEDIVDSGLSLRYLKESLIKESPLSLHTVSLLRKPEALKVDVTVDFVGFDIENKFVVGYGLDYQELGRGLDGIYVLDEA